jgi:hypothetical protein
MRHLRKHSSASSYPKSQDAPPEKQGKATNQESETGIKKTDLPWPNM